MKNEPLMRKNLKSTLIKWQKKLLNELGCTKEDIEDHNVSNYYMKGISVDDENIRFNISIDNKKNCLAL